MYDDEDEGYPCNTCAKRDSCDSWDAQFCCKLCAHINGGVIEESSWCKDCDPFDI